MIYSRSRNVLKFYEWFLLFFLLSAGVVGIIWIRSAITALEYNIAKLEQTKLELVKERKVLLAERASLTSYGKIEEAISRKQGLHLPDRRYVHLKKRPETSQIISVSGSVRLDRLFLEDAGALQ